MIIFLGNSHSLELYKDIINESKEDLDIVVSCQYPHKVPSSLIDNYICVNIHYGLLPEYAGCNPIYWQIMNGTTAGYTIHYMDSSFDGGDIIKRWEAPIGNMTADELYEALASSAYTGFRRVYDKIIRGTAPRKKQDLRNRKYYKQGIIDFNRVVTTDKEVRALHFKGKQLPKVVIGTREYQVSSSISSVQ